jgi:hypothetical protein
MFAAGDGLGFEWPAVTAGTDYSGPHAPGKSSFRLQDSWDSPFFRIRPLLSDCCRKADHAVPASH